MAYWGIFVVLVMVGAWAGCGDDDTNASAGTSTSVGTGGTAGAGASGGGGGCTIGSENCPCDDGMCGEGLVCVEELCLARGPVEALTVGRDHACVLLTGGRVRCWGLYGAVLGYPGAESIGDDETVASMGDVDIGGTAIAI